MMSNPEISSQVVSADAARSSIRTRRNMLPLSLLYVVCLVLFLLNSLGWVFVDELDNWVGGRFINHGLVLYSDYFSHHLPLPYYLSAALLRFTGDDFVALRLVWGGLQFSFWLALHGYLRGTEADGFYPLLVVVMALTAGYFWAHLLLAETIVAYLTVAAWLILLFRMLPGYTRRTDLYLLCFIVLGIATSSAGYLYLAAAILLFAFATFCFRTLRRHPSWRRDLLFAPAGPIFVLVMYFVISNTGEEMIDQAYWFNVQYYSRFLLSDLGTPAGYLGEILSAITRRAASILSTFGNQEYAVVTGFLLLNGCVTILLIMNGRSVSAFATLLLTILSFSPRAPIPATNTQVTSHLMPHFLLTQAQFLVCPLLIAQSLRRAWRARRLYEGLRRAYISGAMSTVVLLAAVWALVVPVKGGLEWYVTMWQPSRSGSVVDVRLNGVLYAQVLGNVMEPGEKTWVGPFLLADWLYLPLPPVSRIVFYLPWHAASESLTDELIHDLEANQPPIIVFERDAAIWGIEATDYAERLTAYIDSNYVSEDNPVLRSVYVLRSRVEELKSRFRRAGY